MAPKQPRPNVVSGITTKVATGCGSLFATINQHDGNPFEMFLKLGSQGTCVSSFMAALATLISVALRSGAPLGAFQRVLSSATCPAARKEVVDIVLTSEGVEEVESSLPSCMSALGHLIGETTEYAQPPQTSTRFTGTSEDTNTGCGNVTVGCFSLNGPLARVTVEIGAPGSCASAIGATISKCINIALAYEVDPQDISKALMGIHCQQSLPGCTSCLDAIGQKICPPP
jgi:hypothetical protein